MTQLACQGDIAEQLIASGWLPELKQGRGAKEVRLGDEIVVATGLRGVEHLGNDGQPRRGRAGYPHRVVNGEFCSRQGARIVRGSGQLYGPACCLDDLGTREAVRSVPHRTGQRCEHPGLQGQRAVRRLQLLRGLAEKAEQLDVLRA